jgi:branched-chain amino acid transport system permease protein
LDLLNAVMAGVVSGIVIGTVYGALALAVVLLFKATGVANFAQGNLATVSTVVVFVLLTKFGLPLWLAIAIGIAASAALGFAIFSSVLLPNQGAGAINLTTRTLALYMLLFAATDYFLGVGQPFPFPSVFPSNSFALASIQVGWSAFGTLAVSSALALGFWAFFRLTRIGLMMRGMAENRPLAELLGVRTRFMESFAWAIATVVGLLVGIVIAPNALLSAGMTDAFLLYAFTSAILGGLTSLPGAFVGGLVVGIVSNVTAVVYQPQYSLVAVFVVLVLTLLLKPDGLFGHGTVERV